ncbi:MAG: type II toxin-antitoxin system VapC family toxin [Rhodoferax sp.]
MILFCDTSALMKVYAQELHSDWTRHAVTTASPCMVSQITWVEMCSALALKDRTRQITHTEGVAAMDRLKKEWGGYSQLAVDSTLITSAGNLAQTFGLRAYDSLQLASVLRVHSQAGAAMAFCCFDRQLNAAAGALGIQLTTP